jgi:hypothetical protein
MIKMIQQTNEQIKLEVGDFVIYTPKPNTIAGQINAISPDYERAFVVYPIGLPHIFSLTDLALVQKGTLDSFSWDLAHLFMDLLKKNFEDENEKQSRKTL